MTGESLVAGVTHDYDNGTVYVYIQIGVTDDISSTPKERQESSKTHMSRSVGSSQLRTIFSAAHAGMYVRCKEIITVCPTGFITTSVWSCYYHYPL